MNDSIINEQFVQVSEQIWLINLHFYDGGINMIPVLPAVDTHKAHILYRLLNRVPVKNKDMWSSIDSSYSACRISELRSDGWNIEDHYLSEDSKLKKRVRVKVYFIPTLLISELLKEKTIQDFLKRFEYRQAS